MTWLIAGRGLSRPSHPSTPRNLRFRGDPGGATSSPVEDFPVHLILPPHEIFDFAGTPEVPPHRRERTFPDISSSCSRFLSCGPSTISAGTETCASGPR